MLVNVLRRNTMENKKMHGINSGKESKEELNRKKRKLTERKEI